MTFEEALEQLNENQDLDGKKIKGGTIDEIVIFPSDENSKNIFKDRYFNSHDALESIEPFKHEQVSICAVINKHLLAQKIFITAALDEVYRELKK